MKKFIILLILTSFVGILLCGCTTITQVTAYALQYSQQTDTYDMIFAFSDQSGNETDAECDVNITIVNDNNETVYSGDCHITKNNFTTTTNMIEGTHYAAIVGIPASDIQKGTSSSGKAYLTIYKDGKMLNTTDIWAPVYSDLPISDITLTANLPVEITFEDYDYDSLDFDYDSLDMDLITESVITITDIEYTYNASSLIITVYGEKTYGDSSDTYECITCKIYDSNGYLVDSESIMPDSLTLGDKFKEDYYVVGNIVPGENYTITFEAN